MDSDKYARPANDNNKNRKIYIVYTGTFSFSHFADVDPEDDTISEFYGWNCQRQIYFDLVAAGYTNIESK